MCLFEKIKTFFFKNYNGFFTVFSAKFYAIFLEMSFEKAPFEKLANQNRAVFFEIVFCKIGKVLKKNKKYAPT